jgi:hypothetical protein
MPTYQTKIKGEKDWSEPESHPSYQAAAELELDVFFSAFDDDDADANRDRYCVIVRDATTGAEIDVFFRRQDDGSYGVVGAAGSLDDAE